MIPAFQVPGDIAIEQKRFVMQTEERMLVNTIPPWGNYYNDFVDQTTVAATGAQIVARTFVVPSNRRCVVRYMGAEANDPSALPFIRTAFLVNGSVHRNYQNPPALLGTISNPTLIYVELEGDNSFSLVITNSGSINYLVFTRIVAWHWDPLAYDPARYRPELAG